MTLRERLHDLLTDRYLWPQEADAVIEQWLEGLGETGDMRRRMADAVEGYPPQLLAVCLMGLEREALAWIDANKPEHFARPMFAPKEPSDA